MMYARVENGAVTQYPYTLEMLKRDHADVSFPKDASRIQIAEWGVVQVEKTAAPARSSLNVNVVEGTPVLLDGVWKQSWSEVPAPADAIADRQREAENDAIRQYAKAETFVQRFVAMTPAQVLAYVEANVGNLAQAKTLLGKLAVMMLITARSEFRDGA